MTIEMVKALEALKAEYEFLNTLIECGDAEKNPQYYTSVVNELRGMREMFQIVFGNAPYAYAACLEMFADI